MLCKYNGSRDLNLSVKNTALEVCLQRNLPLTPLPLHQPIMSMLHKSWAAIACATSKVGFYGQSQMGAISPEKDAAELLLILKMLRNFMLFWWNLLCNWDPKVQSTHDDVILSQSWAKFSAASEKITSRRTFDTSPIWIGISWLVHQPRLNTHQK